MALEVYTHSHRSSRAGSVVVVSTTGSPDAVTLNNISAAPFSHTGQAGFKSSRHLSLGSSERTTDINDCENEVTSWELLYAGGLALPKWRPVSYRGRRDRSCATYVGK